MLERGDDKWKQGAIFAFSDLSLSFHIQYRGDHRSLDADHLTLAQGRKKHLKLGGHDTSRALFPQEKGAFFKVKRALLCLLLNLGGTCPQCPRFLRLCLDLLITPHLA